MSTGSKEKIPFLDLKKQYLQIRQEVLAATEKVFSDTAFSGGPYVESFEKNFAAFCGTKYAAGVNNGTTALHLAMLALGIKQGDEVLLPANTFIATAWCVSYVNATPVFVDCDPETWEIDASQLEKKITPRTKAIIGVHLYGQPFDLEAVKAVAGKHGIFLIEDAAQAHGAKYNGRHVGSYGELTCFSFYPGKNLGAYGEAGAVVTNNEEYYKHIQSLRNHGSSTRYYHDEIGYNMRMDGLQGAILDIKLRYLNAWNSRRKQIAAMYRKGISNRKIKMQQVPGWADPVYHLFVVTTEKRDDLMKFLQQNNVFPGLHYPVPCHLQKAYTGLGYKKGAFPNAEYLSSHCLSLPMFAELTDDEVQAVIETINKF